MISISVNAPGTRYEVIVLPGLLASAGRRVRELLPQCAQAVIVTDSNVAPLYAEPLQSSLADARIDSIIANVPAGEEYKQLNTIDGIFDHVFATGGVDRSTAVISLGGGVVCDMGGFVAATMLRGLPLVHMPTSLLAMVDASVGGKTGVNHAKGKNLIGAFYQPRAVLADTSVLRSLPQDEVRNGLAECIKHALISDPENFIGLERLIDRAIQLDVTYLTELVGQNVAVKARLVQADPFEREGGERALLNFGHTFAHAFEWASKYALPHGRAVALGMVAASHLSVRMKMFSEAAHERIATLISRAGLPTRGIDAPIDLIFEAMRRDKKIAAGKARFVLLERIGRAVVRDDVPESLVRDAVDSLRR